MRPPTPIVGICSWSLQPESPADLARRAADSGCTDLQLGLDPLEAEWPLDATLAALRDAGLVVRSGMMRMRGEDYTTLETIRSTGGVRLDENWEHNLANAARCGRLAARLGIGLVSFHAGFLPPGRDDPLREVMISRLRRVIDVFAEHGVDVAFETGQETAETLWDCLMQLERPRAGVNFDPANMILYGHGDPVASLRRLAPRVLQIHIKDARATQTPGTWGREMPVGQGQVDWEALFAVYRECRLTCGLFIERESGGQRLDEIRAARVFVQRFFEAGGEA
jgi:L-ribulose-5-phosphate 3-epimerase